MKQVPLARLLPRQPQRPRQDPCRAARPTPAERATLEPTVSNPTNYIGTRAREAPTWWHADLCQDHRYMRPDEDQKTATVGGILAEESHETPRQDPCRGRQHATARPLPGHPARPSSRTPAVPLPGPHQPSLHRRSHAAASPNQLGRYLRGKMQLPGQLSRRLRGGMQIFVKTLPPRHLSCLPAYMAPQAPLARARVNVRGSGDGRDRALLRPR